MTKKELLNLLDNKLFALSFEEGFKILENTPLNFKNAELNEVNFEALFILRRFIKTGNFNLFVRSPKSILLAVLQILD